MNKSNLIRVHRIICTQGFTLENREHDLPVRTGESLSGDCSIDKEQSMVKVTVLESSLRIDEIKDQFLIDLKIFIDTDLIIKNNAGLTVPVKLSFGKSFNNLVVAECPPSQVSFEIWKRLCCQVFSLEANGQFYLHPEKITYNQELSITLIVEIGFEDRIELALSVPPAPPILSRTEIPREVIIALELAAGKIRSQIGRQRFKQELLGEVNKTKKLLLSGNLTGALALLTAIKEQVLVKLSTSKGHLVMAYPVLGDLEAAEKQVINLL